MIDPREFVYRLDPADRVVYVNDAWRAFAAENGCPDLADRVLGTSVWDYVTGPDVRHLWRLLLARTRTQPPARELSYRCDAPELRRDMALALRHLGGGEVEVRSRVVNATPRGPVPSLAPREGSLDDPLLILCAWCNRVQVEGAWMELEDAAERLRLFTSDVVPRVSHGLCPACKAALLKDVSLTGNLAPRRGV